VPGSERIFAQPDPSTAPQGNFKVLVSGTAPGSDPHDIVLKATQIPGGQPSQTTDFAIKPESVVQVKQGENINVTTSESMKVKNVKAKNVQGQQVDLMPLPNNIWSLQNLVPGVYLLDVIVDMSASGIQGVYETVVAILQPDQAPLPPSTVINEVSIIIENGPPLPPPNETNPSPAPPPPDCDVPSPPPECAPTECPDGRIMPPGEPCPDDALPCDVPNPSEGCSVPTECPDGSIIPPGEQCPEDPPEDGDGNDDGNGEDGSNGDGDRDGNGNGNGNGGDASNGDGNDGGDSGGDNNGDQFFGNLLFLFIS
jgi:hypothetical protein